MGFITHSNDFSLFTFAPLFWFFSFLFDFQYVEKKRKKNTKKRPPSSLRFFLLLLFLLPLLLLLLLLPLLLLLLLLFFSFYRLPSSSTSFSSLFSLLLSLHLLVLICDLLFFLLVLSSCGSFSSLSLPPSSSFLPLSLPHSSSFFLLNLAPFFSPATASGYGRGKRTAFEKAVSLPAIGGFFPLSFFSLILSNLKKKKTDVNRFCAAVASAYTKMQMAPPPSGLFPSSSFPFPSTHPFSPFPSLDTIISAIQKRFNYKRAGTFFFFFLRFLTFSNY